MLRDNVAMRFPGRSPTWLVPRHGILMVDTQHESSLCNQFRLESESICHSTTPKVVAAIVIAHPDSPPCFPPISEEVRPNFAGTLISSEVAPRYLPSSRNCSPTASPRPQISWIVLPFSRPMLMVGRAFRETHAFFVPVRGRGRIVMEVHDGWV